MENAVTAGFWLSPQQKRVWTLQQDGAAYRSICLVHIDGNLRTEDLRTALSQLVTRNEILRTVYRRQPGMTFPFQVVLENADPSLDVLDVSDLPQAEQTHRLRALFRHEELPGVGPESVPLLTAKLAMLGPKRHALILSVPALAADARSLEILVKQLEQILTGTTHDAGVEPLRYVQFAQWQNDLVGGDDESASKGKEFWKDRASAVAAITLPYEVRSPGRFQLRSASSSIDTATWSNVGSLAGKLNASRAEILLAAWQSVLWRLSGQSTFAVGTVFDGREYDELRDAVGLIAKMLPIHARFDGDFRFREVVEHVRDTSSQAAEWQEYYVPGTGFDSAAPVCFEYLGGFGARKSDGLSLKVEETFTSNESYRLKLSATPSTSGARLELQYDGSRFGSDSIERLLGYLGNLLTAALADPEAQVSRLALLGEAERNRLVVEWNQTAADYPRDKCLHQLFEAQVAATPDRPAIRFNEQFLTYAELNGRANQVAHYLRTLGVDIGSLVGLCVERSADMMVALLGILKAGGAYVPLNPDNPKARLVQQLTGAKALITESRLLGQMPEFAGKTVSLDSDQQLWNDRPRTDSRIATDPENLVYVIYTSGSTGVPKGVAVRHRNLVNYSHFITERLRLNQEPDGLHFGTVSTIGADLGNTCIFPALISGGCLHVMSYDVSTDAQRFSRYTAEHPLDVLKIVPSHLQALLQSPEARGVLPRRYLILGGETLTPALMDNIQKQGGSCEVLNHYGPTETTVGSLTLKLLDYNGKNAQASSIPIGRPIANTQVYILDPFLQPVPAGVIGELYIAGDGVTAGYLNQPDRTAERFVPNPFGHDSGASMYRTGDLARYLSDGNVEFLGRGDDQVKIRGFRVELGEIETVLSARAGVKQAVVLAREDERGDKRLIAYVVVDHAQKNSPEELRTHLKEQLPDVMVPSAIVLLPKIPLNANGKIDRQALPEPQSVETKSYIAPQTPTEEGVAKIWIDVLRRERIGTDENFFDLGGHSLLATQVVSRVREHFKIELPIRALFDRPTIGGLAEAIATADKTAHRSQEPAIVRVAREQYRAGKT